MERVKKENPLISVIVPVYNGEKYLRECIDSILEQDYKNIELILIDDGSSDNSRNIIGDYANKDKRVIAIHQENAGVCASRNKGLDNSHGEYICLIDQDDYVEKNYLSYLYELILNNNAEISLTPTARKFTSKNPRNDSANVDYEDKIEIWSGVNTAREMLYYNLRIAPWNKMINRHLIEKNNIRFDLRYFGGEGFLFSIDCFIKAKRVAVGHKEVYNYRCDNPNSGMTKFSMKVIDSSINSQKTIRENVLKVSPELENACKYANWHTHCDCLNFFVGCCVIKQYKEKYKEVKKVCRQDALCVVNAKVPIKEKVKGFLYFINPYVASKFINEFQLRKFTVDSKKERKK